MDQRKLVGLIKQFSLIWDKSNPHYRDKDAKDKAWTEIGVQMGCSGEFCQKTFKSLREKYIRERDKTSQSGAWELIPDLRFLDPNIFTLKQLNATNESSNYPIVSNKTFQEEISYEKNTANQNEQDRLLIDFVRENCSLWNRNSNTYPNKTLKLQLWQNIAAKLNSDTSTCMLRWKSLREKYIRQKTKYLQDGEKWELLDDMSFLDKVIQYRKKYSETDTFSSRALTIDEVFSINDSISKQNHHYQHGQEHDSNMSDAMDDSTINDSSSDYQMNIKQEPPLPDAPDSSWNHTNKTQTESRKRGLNFSSNEAQCESSLQKKAAVEITPEKLVQSRKDPEELFGELVTALLREKTGVQRKACMVEIMSILTR